MYQQHRKISRNCLCLVELTQNVEEPHLNHKNGLTHLTKHVLQHHHHHHKVLRRKHHLAVTNAKAVCNKLHRHINSDPWIYQTLGILGHPL